MKSFFKRIAFSRFIYHWFVVTTVAFCVYEFVWLPVDLESGRMNFHVSVKTLPVDYIICALLSFMNCIAINKMRHKWELNRWTSLNTTLVCVCLLIFNLLCGFPITKLESFLYLEILPDSQYYNIIYLVEVYVLSSITTLITIVWLLIWISSAYRIKEKSMAEMRLKTLKAQLNPHFLFNGISIGISLIDEDPSQASAYFLNLSKSLRTVMNNSLINKIPLRQEIDDVDPYLKMLQIRFGNALSFHWEISDEVMAKSVLSGTLFIALENIVKHNKISSRNPLYVRIGVDDDKLIVENEMRPISPQADSYGIGTDTLVKRYDDLGAKSIAMVATNGKFIISLPLFQPLV